MNSADYERTMRSSKLARTYLAKATRSLQWWHGRASRTMRESLAWEAVDTLERALWEAETLAEIAHFDRLDDLERQAKTVVGILRRRRLVQQLGETSGRTKAEAAAFTAAADRLRQPQPKE